MAIKRMLAFLQRPFKCIHVSKGFERDVGIPNKVFAKQTQVVESAHLASETGSGSGEVLATLLVPTFFG